MKETNLSWPYFLVNWNFISNKIEILPWIIFTDFKGFEMSLIEENVEGCMVEYVGEPIEEEASSVGSAIGAL